MYLVPPPLEKGDAIRIIAPCGAFDRERFMQGVEILRARGYDVRYDDGVFARHRYLADDDERRRRELEAALVEPNVKAVWEG